ncbi:hypothetical protein A3SI_18632 [Nitritalea halalkaliphila LW7]|uniref:Uncharacterized protein n=1 Tax=Nitritalea halalkaliphila LW7 TaxID=1189621 RepID=I5BU63_9BACT|nr:hypothetical protein [Nitritalea halalkaliphila]EIM73115.1 hypothetical protein A3SI_18632 [Nitritalea halalkaliphila LW7]
MQFEQRMAWYALKPAGYQEAAFYQRYLLFYELFPGFAVGASLKAHAQVAQNLDLRLRYQRSFRR